jgi:hypothetical protein
MKTKSQKRNWALALCAVAVVSFTAAGGAQARMLPDSVPGPIVIPLPTMEQTNPRSVGIEPLPYVVPQVDVNGAVKNGTFRGTVIGD